MNDSKTTYLCILILFFISGSLGLGYQVIWSKYLLDFIGVSAFSYATVLAAFMGGLAIGSWLIGKFADRVKSPLKLYAYLELGIGAYAVAYIPLSSRIADLYAHWVSFTPEQSGGTTAIGGKIISSALLLLLPTILMGGTYPALLRHVTQSLSVVGRKASQLYAANSFGAVIGTLLMSFAFLPLLGMSASLMLLAILNTVLGIVSLVLSQHQSFAQSPPRPNEIRSQSADVLSDWQVQAALLLILVEGFFAFVFEIAWTRYFGIVLGSTTYSFSIMLAAFISGIALGSAWLAKQENRIGNPLARFGQAQVIVALLTMIPLPLYPYVPWLFEQYSSMLSTRPAAFYLYEFGKLLFCYIVMLPPALFIGMSLPLMVKGLSHSLQDVGKDAGRIYSWNTMGNVLGASAAGLFLLPALGMEFLLYSAAAGTILLGILSILFFTRRSAKVTIVCATLLLVTFCYPALTKRWDQRWFTLLPFNRSYFSSSLAEARGLLNHSSILLAKDDAAGHILVKQETLSKQHVVSLLVNGKVDASTEDMISQILCAQIPMLLHPDPRNVLVIGLATGISSNSALTHPIERSDTVEIIRRMPEATKLFSKWNGNVLSDPRFHMIHDDARTYISYTRQKYDVIISEPSNPWMAGVGSLYSKDFYERTKQALSPNGYYLQWLQAYEMSDDTLSAVFRSFHSAYPYIYVFQGQSADLLLLGANQRIQPDWVVVERRFQLPEVRRDLARINVHDLISLLYTQLFSPATVELIANHASWENTDDNHALEYRAPQDLFTVQKPTVIQELDERLISSPDLFWSKFARGNFQAHLTQTMSLLADEGIGSPELLKANQIAYYHFNGNAWRQSQLFLLDPPESQNDLAAHLQFLTNEKSSLGQTLLKAYRPSILLESLLSNEKARFWMTELGSWLPSRKEPAFRSFWIELLMASGENKLAAEQLLQWVHSSFPPAADWAILRASQMNSESIRSQVMEAYSHRGMARLR